MVGFALSALWAGMVMAVHPCPLATNVVAIGYISKHVGSTRRVVLGGLLYTAARTATYLAISVVLMMTALSNAQVAQFLQRTTNRVLGPLLIIVGMVLLRLIPLPRLGPGLGERAQERVRRSGIWGAALLGVAFALAFCPPEAVVFFGLLVVSAGRGSRLLLPAMYGLGTGLPVMAFAIVAAVSARSVSGLFNRLTQVERWARAITGTGFILLGIYFCLAHIFQVIPLV